uniref:Uncharacterized protein n=1 Tax=Romanomermis culicivorax TaxID=13658 RepID=A0A915J8E8_ROMCU
MAIFPSKNGLFAQFLIDWKPKKAKNVENLRLFGRKKPIFPQSPTGLKPKTAENFNDKMLIFELTTKNW